MSDKVDTLIRERPAPVIRAEATRPALCVLTGVEAGRVILLDRGRSVIGRSEDAGVRIDREDVSRHHAEVVVLADHKVLVADAGSTNGTWLNGNRIYETHCRLEEGDRVHIGETMLKLEYQDVVEQRVQQSLYDAAARDALTGIYNKRYFVDRLEQECAYSVRHGTPLSLALFDLDHFKLVNDGYGHVVGDRVLEEVARRVQGSIRREDVLARYGGEEFAVIMRETTLAQAHIVVQRLSARISSLPILANAQRLIVTTSSGVAERVAGGHAGPGELVARADQLLYAAKAAGRNCIRLEGAA